MGRIRLSAFRHSETLNPGLSPVKLDLNEKSTTEYVESIEIPLDDANFPIFPRKTKDDELPFISPAEVKKRNGQEGRNFCEYQPASRSTQTFFFLLVPPADHSPQS